MKIPMGPAEAALQAEVEREVERRQHFAFEDAATWKHDLPPVEWLIPGVIPAAGLVQLSGAPKAGKSFFTLALLKASLAGGFFLGHRLPNLTPAWLFVETDAYSFKAQMDELDLDPAPDSLRTLPLHKHDGLNGDDFCNGIRNRFHEAEKRGIPPKLVILDTMARWLPMKSGDRINDYSSGLEMVRPLAQLASDLKPHGVTFLAVHHARKGATGDGAESSLGSQSISGSFDSTLILTRKPGSKSRIRFLNISSRFGYDPEIGERLAFRYDGSTMVTADPSAELDDEIMAVVGPEGMAARDIQETLESEVDIRTVQRRLKALTGSGELAAEGAARSRKYTRKNHDIATEYLNNPVSQYSNGTAGAPAPAKEPTMFPHVNMEH